MIKKEDSTGKNLHDGMKGIGGILSLCTVGKKDLLYRQWIIVQSATVSIVKADRIRSHVSTKGLEGRSLEREVMIDASLYMIGWGQGFSA